MKTRVAFFFIMTSIAFTSRAGTVAAPYQIGTWRGFRPAAISFTFDDNLPNQYAVAVPMFNAKGFKITLFTVSSWPSGGSWSAGAKRRVARERNCQPYRDAFPPAGLVGGATDP